MKERTFIVMTKVADHDADLLTDDDGLKVALVIRAAFAGTAIRILECEPEGEVRSS